MKYPFKVDLIVTDKMKILSFDQLFGQINFTS